MRRSHLYYTFRLAEWITSSRRCLTVDANRPISQLCAFRSTFYGQMSEMAMFRQLWSGQLDRDALSVSLRDADLIEHRRGLPWPHQGLVTEEGCLRIQVICGMD
jgi:hypothetical protein